MLEILILGIAGVVFIAPVVTFIVAVVKKKKLLAVITAALYIGFILWLLNACGAFAYTHVHGRYLDIVNWGTGSMGSHAEYSVDDPEIMYEQKEIDKGVIYRKFGWRFKSVKQGECDIIVREYDCAGIAYVDVYHVTADKNLMCTYTTERVEFSDALDRYLDPYFGGEEYVIRLTDGEKIIQIEDKEQIDNIRRNIFLIYGHNADCDPPDTSGMAEFYLSYIEYDPRHEPHDAEAVMYIDGDKYYYPIELYDGSERWGVFTLDDDCKTDIYDLMKE